MGLADSGAHASGPHLVDTPLGPVESVDVGSGPPVLFLHGSPGGYDQGVLMTRFLAGSHRVIAISRPGYLGTPLTHETSAPAAQAELAVAVLDALEIERCALMCWSGGGPAAYSLAAAVPDRVASMVAVAAVSTRFDPRSSLRGRLELSEERLLFSRFSQWLTTTLAAKAPSTAISTLLSGEGDLSRAQIRELTAGIVADDDQRALATDLFATVSGVRKAGFDNDFDQFRELDPPLADITAPVLAIHARTDADVPFDQSVHAVDTLVDARLEAIDEGTHLSMWLGSDAPRLQALVGEHLAAVE
ncbi:alpha/beta hydrolase [Gordonia hongkongensis]|uniref:Alpha/beta hydrolase n=2 Tax=Bacteria TaxID=2 RepID=A0AAX3T289_9ACTN|nr:alpha/beta hydrolase [Gordonia hongkongensis]QIK47718.1 alpha/beta hydrolase [Gordonia terrae]WFP23240.1 alpha/beta hydrolase [Gordonia hongkongensis]